MADEYDIFGGSGDQFVATNNNDQTMMGNDYWNSASWDSGNYQDSGSATFSVGSAGGDTSIGKWLSAFLAGPGGKNIAGGVISGIGTGLLQMLKQKQTQKDSKELLAMKYGLENQQVADTVARASSMPSVRRMAPAQNKAAMSPNWQAPGLIATKRGMEQR